MVNIVKNCWSNIKKLILYSDSDMVELACGLLIIYIATSELPGVFIYTRILFIVIGLFQVIAIICQNLRWRNTSNVTAVGFFLYLSLYSLEHSSLLRHSANEAIILTLLSIWCYTRTRRELT